MLQPLIPAQWHKQIHYIHLTSLIHSIVHLPNYQSGATKSTNPHLNPSATASFFADSLQKCKRHFACTSKTSTSHQVPMPSGSFSHYCKNYRQVSLAIQTNVNWSNPPTRHCF